jgi:hypothetical protein
VRNFKQASVRKSRLYTCLYHNLLKDAVQLLNPEDEVSHEECSGESSVSEVEAECEPQPLDVHLIEQDDETQIAANTSESSPNTFLRTKYTQTKASKPTTRSVKTQTHIDATSGLFHEMKQSFRASESSLALQLENEIGKGQTSTSVTETSGIQQSEFEVDEVSSASEESVEQEFEYSPTEATTTESEDTSEEVDSKTRVLLQQGKPPQEQIKFVVFEDAVLEAFGTCSLCGSKCTVTVESQRGSSCKITSCCTRESNHHLEWMTGPTVNGMPVFHLLLASGVLATGMECSKVLRLFAALKIPNVKRRELSNIFKYYAIPTVYNVWQKEQLSRLNEIDGKSVVVASDMRVDSPGHSGLFGSGSTMDMDRNIILDTQVIKV